MIELRPFATLGGADHGWLNAKHHFSFADYRDPARDHWGALRVWNDDHIAPHSGFPPHPHRDMEIITYVHRGAISHRDSLGNSGRTAAGEVQVMSAGSGITHAEYNLEDEATDLFQIWILPDEPSGTPRWDMRPFPRGEFDGRFVTLASGRPGDGDALLIRANARVLAATLPADASAEYRFDAGRQGYLVPASGSVEVNGVLVGSRDGAAIRDDETIHVTAREASELVLVDVA